MEATTKHFARFYYIGSLVASTKDIELPAELRPEEIEFPKYAYCFNLYKVITIEDDGILYKSDPISSDRFYWHPDSYITDYYEVKQCHTERGKYLLDNMERNGWERMIWTRYKDFPLPYNPDTDIILPKKEGNK